MGKKEEQIIKDFQVLFIKAHIDYEYFYKKVNDLDYATQDLLHQIELGEKVVVSQFSKQLIETRQERRLAKDISEKLKPLHEYYLMNKAAINALTDTIGYLRKYDKFMKERTYRPKILKNLLIDKPKILKNLLIDKPKEV